LNSGATFYLQKGRDAKSQYAELAHKIRHAVRQFRAERSVKESQALMKNLLDFLPDPTIAMDMDGTLIMWNRATEEMTGVPAARVMGTGDYEYTIPFFGEKRPLIADLLRRPDEICMARHYRIRKTGPGLLIGECQATFPDGGVRYFWEKASLFYDSSGNITGVIESIRDITARKRIIDERQNNRELLAKKIAELSARNDQLAETEEELRQTFEELQQEHLLLQDSERNFRFLVDSLPDALVIHDNGHILFLNPAALRLFRQIFSGDLFRASLFTVFGDEPGRDLDARSRLVLSGSTPVSSSEYTIPAPGGKIHRVEAAFSPVRYRDTNGVQIIFHDLAEQQRIKRRPGRRMHPSALWPVPGK
jgi:PAS domain S-box-containing protein